MISITKATEKDYKLIVTIGRTSVREAHKNSCPEKDMDDYLERNYNDDVIQQELNHAANIYYILTYDENPVGFSKINLDTSHPGISKKNITKLDRIYLLPQFHGLHLGYTLLNHNIEVAKEREQSAMWLFTWVGNSKAINFYLRTGFKIIGSDRFKVSETHYNDQYQMLLGLDPQ